MGEPNAKKKSEQVNMLLHMFYKTPVMDTVQYRTTLVNQGVMNPSARMSNAVELGYRWRVIPIPKTNSSMFHFLGKICEPKDNGPVQENLDL